MHRLMQHPLVSSLFAAWLTFLAFHFGSVLVGMVSGALCLQALMDWTEWWVRRERRKGGSR
jgi:hypothetical protein